MCYNCGCQNPDDDMGDVNNITNSTLAHVAEHWGKTFDEARVILMKALETQDKNILEDSHIKEMFVSAAKAWGQSVDESKKNTLSLLRKEVKN